jgi:hypothetical protein
MLGLFPMPERYRRVQIDNYDTPTEYLDDLTACADCFKVHAPTRHRDLNAAKLNRHLVNPRGSGTFFELYRWPFDHTQTPTTVLGFYKTIKANNPPPGTPTRRYWCITAGFANGQDENVVYFNRIKPVCKVFLNDHLGELMLVSDNSTLDASPLDELIRIAQRDLSDVAIGASTQETAYAAYAASNITHVHFSTVTFL